MLQEKLRNWSIRSLLGHCPQVTNKSLRGLIHGSFLLCLVVGSNGGHRLVRCSFFFCKLNYLENYVKKKKRREGGREDTKTDKEGRKEKERKKRKRSNIRNCAKFWAFEI